MLGVVYRKLAEYEKASQYLSQLLESAKVKNNISGAATATHHIAWIHLDRGDLAGAKILGEEARQMYELIKDLRGIGDADEQLGFIAIKMGKFDLAESLLSNSLNLRRELQNQQGMASALRRLAVLKLKQRRFFEFINYEVKSMWLYLRLNMLSVERLQKMFREIFSGL